MSLSIPTWSSDIATIVGIDPGSSNLGVGILRIQLSNLSILNSEAFTINGSNLSDSDSWSALLHGDRFNRIKAIETQLIKIFSFYQANFIYSESPFFGRSHPNAFQALVEVMNAIRNAVVQYDPWLKLNTIPPSSVKNGVGVKGNADKFAMKNAILNLNQLNYNGQIPLDKLDEHSIDALSVAYSGYLLFRN